MRLALRGHLRVVAEQLDVATVFTREWRYLEDEGREEIVAERRRYEERWRALFREGVESGGLRTDLDAGAATLLVLSAANWAYTWLEPGRDTDELADRFTAILVDGDPRLRDSELADMRALLIVNPFASGVDEHRLAAVPAALPPGVETRLTTVSGDATEIATEGRRGRRALRPRRRRHLQRGAERRPRRRPARVPPRRRDERAPAGARPSAEPGARGQRVALGPTRRIGLGRVNGRRFGFSAGLGFDAELVRKVDELGRRPDGRDRATSPSSGSRPSGP